MTAPAAPRAVHAAACAAIVAFAVALELPQLVAIPLPWYQPVDHAWSFGAAGHGIAMGFYGRCLYAAVAAAVAAAAALAVARRRVPGDRATSLFAALAIAAVLAVAVRETSQLVHRDLATSPRVPAVSSPAGTGTTR